MHTHSLSQVNVALNGASRSMQNQKKLGSNTRWKNKLFHNSLGSLKYFNSNHEKVANRKFLILILILILILNLNIFSFSFSFIFSFQFIFLFLFFFLFLFLFLFSIYKLHHTLSSFSKISRSCLILMPTYMPYHSLIHFPFRSVHFNPQPHL